MIDEEIIHSKDQYAAAHFGKYIPIAQKADVVKNSHLDIKVLPSVFETLDKLRSIPVSDQVGWGWFDHLGIARFGSWQAWVTKPQIMVKKPNGDFFTWKEVFHYSFVDAAYIHRIMVNINQLLKYIPPERYVIHGSFKPENIVVTGSQVAGLVNWENAAYGDFLYDVATLDLWTNMEVKTLAKVWYQNHHIDTAHYEERIICHQLLAGLNALGESAAENNEIAYQSVVNQIKYLV